ALELLALASQAIEAALLGARRAEADEAPLPADEVLDVGPDPPDRVGGEPVAAAGVEALDRDEEAEVPLLDEVEDPDAVGPVLERDLHDETQVGEDEAPRGFGIAAPFPAVRQSRFFLGAEHGMTIDVAKVRGERTGGELGHGALEKCECNATCRLCALPAHG